MTNSKTPRTEEDFLVEIRKYHSKLFKMLEHPLLKYGEATRAACILQDVDEGWSDDEETLNSIYGEYQTLKYRVKKAKEEKND